MLAVRNCLLPRERGAAVGRESGPEMPCSAPEDRDYGAREAEGVNRC
jgi:hypothetical protein